MPTTTRDPDDRIHQTMFPTLSFWTLLEDHLLSKASFLSRLQHAIQQDYLAIVVATQTTPFKGATVRRIISAPGTAPSTTVATVSGQLIDNAASLSLPAALQSATLQSAAGAWWIL
jgi:hypothetical protein